MRWKSKETTIAYRCPVCGKNIMSIVGVFALSGDLIKLKCDCGESELTIMRTGDGKIRITVPCLMCPSSHTYVIGDASFFNRDLFVLTCAYSGVGVCYIGDPEKVRDALKQADEELIEMLKEAGFDDYDIYRNAIGTDDGSDIAFDRSQIDDIVRFVLSELKDDGGISCGCPAGEGEYDFEYTQDGVRIFCSKCGKFKDICLKGVICADEFLKLESIELTDSVN